MSEKIVVTRAARNAVFMPAGARTDAHIVDVLIEERCPSFARHWTWPITRPLLYRVLGYHKARRMADRLDNLPGDEAFEYLGRELDIRLTLNHVERMPKTGRLVIAANHPTGLADGVAVWQAITKVRKDVLFFANADAIRVNGRFDETIIPVEWVMHKRSPAKTRETLRRAAEAFAEDRCIVIFPSGKLAQMVEGTLTEQEWYSTVIGLARKQKAPILPLNVAAKNSQLYYTLCRMNRELRDITLFHELLNKKRSHFEMTFGKPIDPETLQGDPVELTRQLRDFVAYGLKADGDAVFEVAQG